MQRTYYIVRLLIVLAFLSVGYVALAVHMYRLQVVRHDELYGKAKQKYTTSRTESGQRGRIFDVDGNLLAGNVACRDILAEPRRFNTSRAEIIRILSDELDVPPGDLARQFARVDKGTQHVVEVTVKRGVDIRKAGLLAAYHFRGLRFVDTYRRYYPKGALLANLIGFTNIEGKGAEGIESLMEQYLEPTSGRSVFERDRRGNQLQRGTHDEKTATNGADVYLTIQEPIQQIVEDELHTLVDTFKPRAAYAVMANPKTGAIMAMAQLPNYNANDRSTMRNPSHWRNRILSDGFEPGSVMKAAALAGALDYGVATLDSTFDCEGGYWTYCRRPLRDCHEYGNLTVREIIQKSSNIGTAKVALAMGEGRLYQTLKRFGFGEPTDIGLEPEASGIFRAVPKWDGLSITRFPIGQGVLVTPLQLVQAYSALANEGLMMQLHVIDRTMDPETGCLEVNLPRLKRRAIRAETAKAITSALQLVTTEEGTAPKAAVEGFAVAGKTGTAQKVINGHYSHSKYVASFIGYVPAEAPAFVLLVVADEPTRGGHYGGTVAAPTFSRISDKVLRYLQVAPAKRVLTQLSPSPEAEAYASSEDTSVVR